MDVVWVIKASRLQSLCGGGQLHTPFTGKCLPCSVVPAARFQSVTAWFEVPLLWSEEHSYLAHASGQDSPMELSYVTKLQVDWAVLLTNTPILAFIFL